MFHNWDDVLGEGRVVLKADMPVVVGGLNPPTESAQLGDPRCQGSVVSNHPRELSGISPPS